MLELVLEAGIELLELRPTELKVQAAGPGTDPPVLAADSAEYLQPFANAMRNSRVGFPLPPGKWETRWQAALNPRFPPSALLQGGGRVLVQAGEFRLFDGNGKQLGADRAGSAPMVLDVEKGLFYHTLASGFFSAKLLANAKPGYLFLPQFGDIFRRILIERSERRLLIGGVERAVDPHGKVKPSRSVIQILEIAEPIRTAGPGLLKSIKSARQLLVASHELQLAAGRESIVFSTPAGLFRSDWSLKTVSVVRGAFKVRSFSLDEDGRVYLLAEVGKGLELWLMNRESRRIYSVPLPMELATACRPPVVGYDHSAYVTAGSRVAAIDAKGQVAWITETAGSISGAVVAPDRRLLLAEGPRIWVLNATGEKELLATLPSVLIGAPVLTSKGDLLALSAQTLYCLFAK